MLRGARYGTRDLDRARTFYDAISEILGAARIPLMPGLLGYRGPDGGMLVIAKPLQGEATVGNGVQINLAAPSRAAVDAAHAKALELGGKCEGPPGFRGPEENGFYAAYFRDPDGNKLMAACVGPG
jgi:catechol 2,3-dioxygenase-like lactoylglutathione lyase family enzyme